jgi:ABC-type uncharacterized transport system permease subunit
MNVVRRDKWGPVCGLAEVRSKWNRVNIILTYLLTYVLTYLLTYLLTYFYSLHGAEYYLKS